jgi:hypothetical protein
MADVSRWLEQCLFSVSSENLLLLCKVLDDNIGKLSRQLVVYETAHSAITDRVCSVQNQQLELTDLQSDTNKVLLALTAIPCTAAVKELILLRQSLTLSKQELQSYINDVLSLPALLTNQAQLTSKIETLKPLLVSLRSFRNLMKFRLGIC